MSAPQRLTDPKRQMRFNATQDALKKSTARFITVPAGRRSGKTELAKRKLLKEALLVQGWDDAAFFAAAPTRDQAKRIYWIDLKAMFPPAMVADVSESSLTIRLITNTTVSVIGLDKPQRMEGTPWNGGVVDEIANVHPGAWGENIRPALTDRLGWAWLIGVPEGRNHYYDLVQKAKADTTGEWANFTWKTADIQPRAEVEAARRDLDPLVFQQEYEASFVNFVGRAYYPFSEDLHTTKKLTYNPTGDLGFCFDFNIKPGVACIVQEQPLPGQFHRDAAGLLMLDDPIIGTGVIGEVWIPEGSNTPAVCRRLIKDWGKHRGQISLYGDATGGAGGSAQTEGSDWDLIKRSMYAHFGADRVAFEVPRANPAERARVNAVNTRLLSGDGTVRMMVDPARAPHVVKDLEGVRLLEGGSGELLKKPGSDLSHISDGLGYYVERKFPVAWRGATVSTLIHR